jgi:hypothetical protein
MLQPRRQILQLKKKKMNSVLEKSILVNATAKNSGREAEGVRGNSGERSSKELQIRYTECKIIIYSIIVIACLKRIPFLLIMY